ncbi:hypothetical protein MW887_002576 [Aspergillus wentii]|nr:hypothetical protein MW887_002576 [Aspergillus wentii]
MHFLVLGATGACGSRFCQLALEEGHAVTAFVRNATKIPPTILQNEAVHVIEGTLDDEPSLERASKCGADTFVSFAGPPVGEKGTPLTNGYKALIPKLSSQNITRLLILCTPSYTCDSDTPSFLWRLGAWTMKTFSPGQYREMVSVGVYLTSLSDTVQWTLFRVGGLTNGAEEPVEATFSEKLHAIFLDDITNTALSQHNTYTYLLDSIFALTSLHMASDAHESNSDYIKNALEYQNTAVPAFRSALENVTESNCDALFASAILLMTCAIVSPLLSKQDTTASSLLLLFDFVKGVHYIISTGREWLQNGPFREFITIHPVEELLSDEIPLKPPIQYLQILDPTNAKNNVYDRAIKILNYCFINDDLAIPWLLIVGDEFMDELQNREPLALMIYMYWGVLLSRLDGVWWAKLAGRKLVGELSVSILSGNIPGCGKEWKEAGIWAKREVGLVD